MFQKSVWEKEYQTPLLVTGGLEPQNDFKRFIKWLRKDRKLSLEGLRVLDLGSGLGKNAIFLAERGAVVTGMEISEKAIEIALERARQVNIHVIIIPEEISMYLDSDSHGNDTLGVVTFLHADIGALYPFKDNSFNLVLDVISSNSLNEKGREVYIKEVQRVLKSGGYFFVRALAKDGDKNAENLLTLHPGKEKDTYIMPELGLTERVFSKEDFAATYSKYFTIEQLLKKSGYAIFKDKPYKRNYWLGYMQK